MLHHVAQRAGERVLHKVRDAIGAKSPGKERSRHKGRRKNKDDSNIHYHCNSRDTLRSSELATRLPLHIPRRTLLNNRNGKSLSIQGATRKEPPEEPPNQQHPLPR